MGVIPHPLYLTVSTKLNDRCSKGGVNDDNVDSLNLSRDIILRDAMQMMSQVSE